MESSEKPFTQAQEEILRKLFFKYSKNEDSYINKETFTKLFKELEFRDNETKANKAFTKYDEDADEKLNFQEFKNWFIEWTEDKFLDIRLLRKLRKMVKKNKDSLVSDLETNSININVGDTTVAKTKIELKGFLNHPDQWNHIEHISKGLHINPEKIYVVLRFQTKDGLEILEKVKGLIEDVKSDILKMELDKELEILINSVEFEYFYDENMISIAVTSTHPIFDFIYTTINLLLHELFDNKLIVYIYHELLHKYDFSDLAESKKDFRKKLSQDFKLIYKFGSSVSKLIEMIIYKIDSSSYKSRLAFSHLIASLFQNEAKINFSIDKLSKFDIFEFFMLPKQKMLRVDWKLLMPEIMTKLKTGQYEKLPFSKDVIDLVKTIIVANFSASLIVPPGVLTLHGKTSGIKTFIEFLNNLADDEEDEDENSEATDKKDSSFKGYESDEDLPTSDDDIC